MKTTRSGSVTWKTEDVYKRQVQEVQLFGEVHPDLLNHIDYAAIGRELENSEHYLFTDNGIFYYR